MAEPADGAAEFDCRDCGVRVFRFGDRHANDQDLCLTCVWLRAHPDVPEEVRNLLQRGRP